MPSSTEALRNRSPEPGVYACGVEPAMEPAAMEPAAALRGWRVDIRLGRALESSVGEDAADAPG